MSGADASVYLACDGNMGGGLTFQLDGDGKNLEVVVGVEGWGGPFAATAEITLDQLRDAVSKLDTMSAYMRH